MAKKTLINYIEIPKYFSKEIGDPYKDPKNIFNYSERKVSITNDKGEIIEEIEETIFPKEWSQISANTVATKYFRRTGVPETGREIDIRQLSKRVAKKISQWGVEQNYISKEQAKNLEDELATLTIGQYGAFNSPVWFNLGLDYYGLFQKGENFYVENGKAIKTKNIHEHPQIPACFISSPDDSIDSMVYVGVVKSAKIYKGGSGIGGDWSKVRSAGEFVSGGGYASGIVRFSDLQDSGGRVIKSGGISRRAATMQSIGIWHPDMIDFVKHKYKEEIKAGILIRAGSPKNWESHTIQDLRGQNVNTAIRIDDEFWKAYENDSLYAVRAVQDNKVEKVSARQRLEKIAFATHACGDPGVQNHTIINKWNTCKASGNIDASNPCSEFMFLDNTACNLASLNLMKFKLSDGSFDLKSFCKAIDRYIISQDIMVSKSSYPDEEIALNSDKYRPLGLGFANLGAYIMANGWAYDSDEARDFAATITSNMTAEAYLQSTKLAEKIGAFSEFEKNKESMLEVIRMHKKEAGKIQKRNGLEGLVESAVKKWKEVEKRGMKYGFRNSQVTLLAPTGTIGFMMDCDTTGCEPEFALIKYKELSGGGSMIIVNETVPLALEKLGYNKEEITKIINYIGEEVDGSKRGTVEGCEYLKKEHLPVFDCSISSGEGSRAISPMGHIKMLGALTPHLSGAISKTVNCPENTSVEEIEEIFYQGWKHGIKALAIYRDMSKASQPLKTKKNNKLEIKVRGEREELLKLRQGITQKVKIGQIPLFIRTGEYSDGRLGEIFVDSLERGSEINRLLNELAVQFSEKLQYGVPLKEALGILGKTGQSQISGFTNHPFLKEANGVEGFLYNWIKVHYLGDIGNIPSITKDPEMRPLPWELRVYQKIPELHLIPTVAGEIMYPGVSSLEETIKKISGTNYWCDEEKGLDTRKTIAQIKKNRVWDKDKGLKKEESGKITGNTCDRCGNVMISDGNCAKCPKCKTSTGGCGGR